MIIEDYVSFEIAKLLNDKRFDEPCIAYFFHMINAEPIFNDNMPYQVYNNISDTIEIIGCPTLQMAMKWLRKVHNLHVDSSIYTDTDGDSEHEYTYTYWDWLIFNSESGRRIAEPQIGCGRYDSYEQACEAAIKYCLENLI